MSASSNRVGDRPAGEFVLPVLFLLVGGVLAFLFLRGGEMPLERSAMGHKGLVTALQNMGKDARYPVPTPITEPDVGLRIIPVVDTNLDLPFERPETREEYLQTGTERDLARSVLLRKLELVPSLVILPKWKRAARLSGYAHESLLLDASEVDSSLEFLRLYSGSIVRPEADILDMDTPTGETITLYAPQLFPAELGDGCQPIMGDRFGALLIMCKRDDDLPFYALSDPDALNNHGLALAGNLQAAAAMIDRLALNKPIWVDTTNTVFVEEERPPVASRDWSDLLRFFAYPFSLLWIGSAALLLLAIWRSWRRFGPARIMFDDQISAARSVSLKAKARLLRTAGNDLRLFESHIEARLRDIAGEVLGPDAALADPLNGIVDRVKRGDPDLASAFSHAAASAMTLSPGTSQPQMIALLEEFELLAERVRNGFGRI